MLIKVCELIVIVCSETGLKMNFLCSDIAERNCSYSLFPYLSLPLRQLSQVLSEGVQLLLVLSGLLLVAL